jgi:hypothetical protein
MIDKSTVEPKERNSAVDWIRSATKKCGERYHAMSICIGLFQINFKNLFDRMTHIFSSIINIYIYKYRVNLVDLKIL